MGYEKNVQALKSFALVNVAPNLHATINIREFLLCDSPDIIHAKVIINYG